MSTKTFTLEEILEALGQNNIPVAVGNLLRYSNRPSIGSVSVIASACALGQCAINLGVDADKLQGALEIVHTKDGTRLSSYIIEQNDSYKSSPDAVAKKVRANLDASYMAYTFALPTRISITELKSS